MAVTRSWEHKTALGLDPARAPVPAERRRELRWMLAASLAVAAGLALVYIAKTEEFPALDQALARGDLVNLNTASEPGPLLPPEAWSLVERERPLPRVGALARVLPIAKLKPLLVVRTPAEYRREFLLWIGTWFAAFYAVHFVWRWRRFRGDPVILPCLHLLTGIGLILAVSIRDPLRDTLEFRKFAWGVALGCILLLLPLVRAFNVNRRWVYTPLLAGFAVFAMLLAFGSGPAGSDSKVNLGPAQPVEVIKILLAVFMAGYFTRKWERLRDLREKRLPSWLWWFEMPRFAHALPVIAAVACALLMFFFLKDLGPALVTGFLFLAMFGIARGRSGLALAGVALIAGGIALGYKLGQPATVVNRISMWLSPWDNDARGGDQLAHSYWALSTGGPLGSGPGRGDPALIPAGHTDLVLSAIGEEWGFVGIAVVCLVFALLIHRAFRVSRRAGDEHALFVGLALATLVALEMIFISAGALGAIPLSGIVAPFLSSGNSAMLANFFVFAIILGISNRPASEEIGKPFARPARRLAVVLCGLGAALAAKAAYVQVLHDRELLERDVRVFQADGVKRAQHNPRLSSLARELTRGNIFDRNGVLLATSDYAELERRREEYQKLGVSIDAVCSRRDNRHYPFGAATAHVLGDRRTGENFHASNASLIEHDLNVKLQGFADYHELAEVVRYRHRPGHAALERLRARDRTVRTPLDIRLQTRAAAALKGPGALVVMDAASGDVLALVSSPERELDRARYGQYPPGSTFKLITAMAALSLDPRLAGRTFHCGPLAGGRVGARIPGWNRPIRDDAGDPAHGSPNMARAIMVSCNAYFAQLGVHAVGSEALGRMAEALEVPTGELKRALPFASYGQGEVVMTPFKMARAVAAIAAGGAMPQGRWVLGGDNTRSAPPRQVISADAARFLANAMRTVVASGTARRPFAGLNVSVAGKTGTAQVDRGLPHSWFAGFAPYEGEGARIAFAVVVEHGGYGSQAAAPIARAVVEAARDLGIIQAR